MGAIEDFAHTLTSIGHDDLVTVLQSMSDGAYRNRVATIEKELASLVSKINELNSKRQQLSGQRSLLERLLKKLTDFMSSNDVDLELTLLQLHLSNHLDTLKGKIVETRPDEALTRKHELTQERALLDAGRKVAITIMGRVAKNQESDGDLGVRSGSMHRTSDTEVS